MKAERQAKILDLIVKKEIGTQEELTMELERAGFVATQATVSRDIREMKLTKVAMSDGKLRYVAYRKTEEKMAKNISAFSGMVMCLWTTHRTFLSSRPFPGWRWQWQQHSIIWNCRRSWEVLPGMIRSCARSAV